jgi:valyl-tRNA synthetase
MGKISKSKGGGPMAPLEMIRRTSADALRYWAAGTSPGKDALISEEKIQMGLRLVTKLWNVARFSERFLSGCPLLSRPANLTAADRWILAELHAVIHSATAAMESYEYAQAKSMVETFFWTALTDNYLEMIKQRLYTAEGEGFEAARTVLQTVLFAVLKMLAPFLPYVTEAIYRELFADAEGYGSIHRSPWPSADPGQEDPIAERYGRRLVDVVSAVRRFKTEHKLGLGSAVMRVQLGTLKPELAEFLRLGLPDLTSAMRADRIEIVDEIDQRLTVLSTSVEPAVALQV